MAEITEAREEASEPAPDTPGPSSSDSQERGRRRFVGSTPFLVLVALGVAIVIKTFLIQAFYIPSESMEPGLILNDRILIQKVSYWGDDDPERGDVVVFKDLGVDGADARGRRPGLREQVRLRRR